MRGKLAELVVAAVVLAWLGAVMAAIVAPDRTDLVLAIAPIIGTVAGAAVAALAITRRNGNNGRNGGAS